MNKLILIISFLFALNSNAQNDTLEIATWNVFLRPAILKDEQMLRVDSIAEYLNNSNSDVLVLQEVFHRKARKRLISLLQNNYPHFTKVGPKSFWGVPSGVVIFSKKQIYNEQKTSFKEAIGSDRLAKKGVVCASIKWEKQKLHIIGTHMQAGGGEKRKKIRRHQLKKIKEFSRKLDTNSAYIFAGDFNIQKSSNMFSAITDSLNCTTIAPSGEIKASCSFPDGEVTGTDGNGKWIDFILLRDKKNKLKQVNLWIEEPLAKFKEKKVRISDHNPVFTRIALQ